MTSVGRSLPARWVVGLLGLLLLAVAVLVAGCAEEMPAEEASTGDDVVAATADLSGVSVEMHKEPG